MPTTSNELTGELIGNDYDGWSNELRREFKTKRIHWLGRRRPSPYK